MATTLDPARLSPGTGEYPLDAGHIDEAFAPTGSPRRPYAGVIDALARHDLAVLRERVQSDATSLGLTFGRGQPLAVDPVPRLIEAAEWDALTAGLLQRSRALNAFLADAYDAQRVFAAGVVPRRLLETSPGYEPLMRGLVDPAAAPAAVAGFDLVRDADGTLAVLEDNLRMPSGTSYAAAVREAVAPALEAKLRPRAQDGFGAALGAALRRLGSRNPRSRSSPTAPLPEPGSSTAGSAVSWGCRWCCQATWRAPAAGSSPASSANAAGWTSSTAGSTRTG